MELIGQLLPVLKVLAAFLVMLVSIRFKIGLGNSIMLGSLSVAFMFDQGLWGWLQLAATGLAQDKTLYLATIVGLILILSDMLEKSGQVRRFMEELSGLLTRPILRLVFFPALIGFLPMPGGAVFSAPMIKGAARGLPVQPLTLAVFNYWFRHVWEPSWPLFPGIILAASLGNIPLHQFILMGVPLTLCMLATGWFFLIRPVSGQLAGATTEQPSQPFNARRSARAGAPLLVAIIGSILLELGIAAVWEHGDYELGVIAALVAAILTCMGQNRLPVTQVLKTMLTMHMAKMLYVVVAIFAFKEVMQGAGVAEQISAMWSGSAALLTATIVLPFLTGMVGGITIAFVGATFPLFIGMAQSAGLSAEIPALCVLGMASGFAGVQASPLHICFLLTCQYFEVRLADAWKVIIRPATVFTLFGIAYYFVLREFI